MVTERREITEGWQKRAEKPKSDRQEQKAKGEDDRTFWQICGQYLLERVIGRLRGHGSIAAGIAPTPLCLDALQPGCVWFGNHRAELVRRKRCGTEVKGCKGRTIGFR